MVQALEVFRSVCPEVVAAVVLDAEGAVTASSASRDLEDLLGPLLTTFSTIAERTTRELGRGGMNVAVLQGAEGTIVARDLGAGRLLAAIVNPHVRLGLLLDDLRACADRIVRETN
jgi:uncharacterized protein